MGLSVNDPEKYKDTCTTKTEAMCINYMKRKETLDSNNEPYYYWMGK